MKAEKKCDGKKKKKKTSEKQKLQAENRTFEMNSQLAGATSAATATATFFVFVR